MKAILFLCLIGISAFAFADDARDQLQQAIDRIKTEFAGLKQHAWAGHYTAGDGFNSVSLWIAPESGAVFQSSGCMHHDRCQGDVASRDGSILIDWAKNDIDDSFVTGRQFVPVHWGRTTLIVPLGRLHALLLATRQNTAISTPVTFGVLRRTNDELPMSNEPQVPVEYQQLLKLPAISATIVSVGDAERTSQSPSYHSLAQELELDVGADDGVLVGMQFELAKRGLSHQVVTITSVTQNNSTGMMYVNVEVGKRISPARRTWSVQTASWR